MADFNFSQPIVPIQDVDTDTSGGDGGNSSALAFGFHDVDGGDGGSADGGDSVALSKGGDADQDGFLNLFGGPSGGDSVAFSGGGDGGTGGDGGDAAAFTAANSSADGGDGGDADVTAVQQTSVSNDFEFNDSFNEDNDTTYIKDSFNEDNDGVDNSGGIINDSVVAGDDIKDSLNSDDDVIVDDSFNTDNSETNIDASDDDVNITEIDDSFKSDNDFLDLDIKENVLDIL